MSYTLTVNGKTVTADVPGEMPLSKLRFKVS
jgi:hypothetical protein